MRSNASVKGKLVMKSLQCDSVCCCNQCIHPCF